MKSFVRGLKKLGISALSLVISYTFLFLGTILSVCIIVSLDLSRSIIYGGIVEIAVLFVFVFGASIIYAIADKKKSSKPLKPLKLIERIGTPLSKSNFNWQGGYSFLATILFVIIFALRAISCLQWAKQIFRGIGASGKDIESKRPNITPFFQEAYFLIWAVFLVCQMVFPINHLLFWVLDIYFMIESFVWILYYSVFRRFFEENYSIYHVLEHLPIIVGLIPLQALAYSLTVSGNVIHTWRDVFIVLLGQAGPEHVIISLVGFLYSAIVISMILAMFPVENVKTGNPNTIIIGAGDVVKNRLLPALVKRQSNIPRNKAGNISVYTLYYYDNDKEDNKKTLELLNESTNTSNNGHIGIKDKDKILSIYDLVENSVKSDDCVAWICSPSNTHWYYLQLLQSKVNFCVVEKPLASNIQDLKRFKEYVQGDNRKNTFFLSYYLLEKALPLTFVCRPRKLYLKYLDDNIKEFYHNYLRSSGKGIKHFEMTILEGFDNRSLPEGGQLIETFVHNCLIASLFFEDYDKWSQPIKTENEDGIKITIGDEKDKMFLVLEKKKSIKESKQNASIIFNDGARINADFVEKTADFIKDDVPPIKVSVKEEYKGKYDVQCDMVYECYANKSDLNVSEVDGLFHQIEVLEWLLKNTSESI